MNVKRIIVDELPKTCWECKAIQGIPPKYLYCFGRHIDIDAHKTRPDWCPLEVEEYCEWVWEEYEMCISPHNNGNWCDKDEYQFCPTCGKRIKYVEVE